MNEFSTLISERWNLTNEVAQEICSSFEKGDSFYFVNDYNPFVSAYVDVTTLSDIFEFLQSIADLGPKKKRVHNALAKSNLLTTELENRIRLCTSSSELDDMLLPVRPNPRSRAQLALKKGLDDLVTVFWEQQVEDTPMEDLAQQYVGKDPSLNTVEEVIAGVKDILVERFAYDETVRSMVREFGYDDGFFEIIPRNKKDKEFGRYRGKMIPVVDLTPEQALGFLTAEQEKHIRFKHGVQLFRITELLRHHFIMNPDFTGFDILCEVIDECWSRYLEPVVEKYVKDRVRHDAEEWAVKQIGTELDRVMTGRVESGTYFAIGLSSGEKEHSMVLVAFASQGNLLGATKEEVRRLDKDFFSKRLQQFFARYRPVAICIQESEFAATAEGIVNKTLDGLTGTVQIVRSNVTTAACTALVDSPWMQQKCSDLDRDMQLVYAMGLLHVQPIAMIPQVGPQFFKLHPLQDQISSDRLNALIQRKMVESKLHKGVSVVEIGDSILVQLGLISEAAVQEVRKALGKQQLNSKLDLARVPGVSESVFRNIAGYLIFPQGENPLDRTTVHPLHFDLLNELTQELNISFETLIASPEFIRSAKGSDYVKAMFIEQRLIAQLAAGLPYVSSAAGKPRRRLSLNEIEEGAIFSGRVTNITQFGVFVDINAACDGLVHISHLADTYVETPDQVVAINDKVDVRVLGVDRKKKRISLSMKNMGDRGLRVKPTQGQLSNLADFFKNR